MATGIVTAEGVEMLTLPKIAAALGANVHAVRSFLRRHRPDLLAAGQRVGGAIGYDERAAGRIREAFEGRVRLAAAT